MIPTLAPYPAYKDSGVPWLAEVPGHWEMTAVKRHFSIVLGKMLQTRPLGPHDLEVPYLKAQHVQWHAVRTSDLTRMWASPAEVERLSVRAGDLLVCEGGEGGRCGLVGHIPAPVIIQNALHRVRPKRLCLNEYLLYVMGLISVAGWFDVLNNKATIAHFTLDKFAALRIPVPPPAEQLAIVRYLDHVDRRIRRCIAAQKKLIALLNEQKQAIIHHAVTRGLDPNVRLKPSGVEWLGDVPEHWEVRRLRFLASIQTGGRDTVDRVDDAQYPFFVRSPNVERIDTYSFDGEAVLTAGDGAGVAKVFHHIDGKFDYHQRVYKFSDFSDVLGRYFYRYFSTTLRYEAFRETAKSTVDSLRLPLLQNFPVLVAPIDEQLRIVDYVDREAAAADLALERAAQEIALLREYRTRLIADVVTGKLDVREAASRLPEEAEEEQGVDVPEDTESDGADSEQSDTPEGELGD